MRFEIHDPRQDPVLPVLVGEVRGAQYRLRSESRQEPTRVRVSAAILDRLVAEVPRDDTPAPAGEWRAPASTLLGLPLEVGPDLRPEQWQLVDEHGRVLASSETETLRHYVARLRESLASLNDAHNAHRCMEHVRPPVNPYLRVMSSSSPPGARTLPG